MMSWEKLPSGNVLHLKHQAHWCESATQYLRGQQMHVTHVSDHQIHHLEHCASSPAVQLLLLKS